MFECHLLFPCRHCCRRCCCRRRRRGDDDDGSCRMLDTAASSSGSNYRRIYTTIKGRFPFNISLFCFLSSSTTKENLHPTNRTLGCLHHHHHHQKLLNLSKWWLIGASDVIKTAHYVSPSPLPSSSIAIQIKSAVVVVDDDDDEQTKRTKEMICDDQLISNGRCLPTL